MPTKTTRWPVRSLMSRCPKCHERAMVKGRDELRMKMPLFGQQMVLGKADYMMCMACGYQKAAA